MKQYDCECGKTKTKDLKKRTTPCFKNLRRGSQHFLSAVELTTISCSDFSSVFTETKHK